MKKTRAMINYYRNKRKLKKSVLKQTRKNKGIIYGARSIKKQIIGLVARPTKDYDILTKKPRQAARKTKKNYNKIVGSKQFYTKAAMHPGTYKVMHKGNDLRKGTKDDFGVVDYSKMPRPQPGFVVVNGVRYRKLSGERKAKLHSLRDKEMKFRHAKDRDDYNRIKASRRLKIKWIKRR